MPEIRSRTYISQGEATFGHQTIKRSVIRAAEITAIGLDTEYTDERLMVDFTGWSRQNIRVTADAIAMPGTIEIYIEELFRDPSGDPSLDQWVEKVSLGTAEVDYRKLFDHNGDDLMRKIRLVIKWKTNDPGRDTWIEFSGRRYA